MDRRRFLLTSMAGALAAPLASVAQTAGKKQYRIGYLAQDSASSHAPYFDAFRDALRERGWVEGRNIAIEARFADGKTDRLPGLAAELVRSRVDLIATSSTPAALAAKRATSTIPIVMGFAADPVHSGIVPSLSHPGGNITGWTHRGVELRAKYLELLKQAVPNVTRFGVLWNPSNPVHKDSLKVIQPIAGRLRVELDLAGVEKQTEIESAFSTLAKNGVGGLIVFPDGLFIAERSQIVALATHYRIPAMYGVNEYAAAGGLMTYGADLLGMFRLGASFVDKILNGAKPADLPIAQPDTWRLVINLKTAKALGLTIPPSLLARADQVIE